ncbi:putative odorant receptor Or5 [Anopheles sinensis]|uniref:Putative odorant receptor Or5 n=1 Tax=Anopheles sinensis TaxID=74873 RepID=A0A084WBD6_ANOSI|nr:putative odorant receptor Or5 [Anopheles sinensis]
MVLPELQDPFAVMPLLLKLQRFVGLWGERQYRYKFRLAFTSFCILVVIPKLAFGYPDLETTVRGTAELIFEWNVLFGMLLFSLKLDDYDQLVYRYMDIAKMVFRKTLPPELGDYLVRINRRIDKFSKIYCCSHLCLAIFYWVAPSTSTYMAYLTVHNKSAPVEHVLHLEEELYWLKIRVSLVDYSIFTVIMLPTIFMLAYFGGLKLLTIFSNVRYCSAMLRLVAMRVQLIDRLDEEQAEKELIDIIVMHQKALKCVELLEIIFRWVFLGQFVQCVMIWCSLVLYVAVTGISTKAANVGVLFILLTVETFGLCFFGTELTTESFSVARAVYDCYWYQRSVSIQKKLKMILQRAQKPVAISAGKFCAVDVERFGNMAKMSYSFYIVLKDQF